MDAQAGLHFCCSQTPEDWFSSVEALMEAFITYKHTLKSTIFSIYETAKI